MSEAIARKRLVVVGNGMVGQRLLEELVAVSDSRHAITVLGEEPRPAYDRVQLSALFSRRTAEALSLVAPDFFARHGIETLLGESASRIDRERRIVATSTGREFAYDRLVLATGSIPFVPAIPGSDRTGCFVYRTIEDLEAIRSAAATARMGTVIGGGLLGLEAAKALKDLGLETHVVEFAPRLMAVQLDDPGGRMLRARIAEMGVHVHTAKHTVAIAPAEGSGHRLNFVDGTYLDTDLVVFSAGIRPRDALARAAGLECGERGGIVIDEDCRTSDPAIFAIGECAVRAGKIYGLVAPGYQMAAVVAERLCDQGTRRFESGDLSTKLKLLGVDVASLGDAHGSTPGARSCSFIDERRRTYKRIVLSEDGRRLLGGILVGDADSYVSWLQYLRTGAELPSAPEQLVLPTSMVALASAATGLAALPDSAQVCSCNDVSKGAICAAVAAGATTIGALKSKTKCATSCGGCATIVGQILRAELARAGVALDAHLCEHFPFSRQQLFQLIRVGELKAFDAVLKQHGRGLGCDICKPAVASILASCWNEFVLTKRHAGLQDTNDYFLANIQKDGTYSVVPRVPGGEITPRQLIVLGEVAQRFRLYTKITGGQRVDLFGAQVHQLPLIWRELIDAGFESGHAYGKALRTVKSCVGSTWCRYGVQDSVGLAIELENRYKGLRAPHKIKFGVSGCTRECAEAQGKDVGVIATEKGWNLYVCGNGGMRPRHAELLVANVDKPTLLRLIDRFLMFYIRTADRLQRTSVWRDNLEGGLEYLRGVVIDDSLGIAAELEKQMGDVRATYACEWKTAIEDPATLKRFRHFVNSERNDENVVFVEERGQIRPATREERETRGALA
jgi:nitrite reductase (NADH) large subunit